MFGRKKRPKQVLCTCRNCKGQFIPRTTRDSHTRADKIHSTLQKEDSARKPQEPSPSPMNSNPFLQFSVAERDPQLNRCTLIKEEVELLSGVPLANPTAPLIFKYDPETHDAYIFPSDTDILQPNSGLYALETKPRANASFLHTENRYCELFKILQAEPHLEMDCVEDTKDLLLRELERMSHEKGLQWAQQRGMVTSGPTLVNTGMDNTHLPWIGLIYIVRNTLLSPWPSQSSSKGICGCVASDGKYLLYSSPCS